MLILSTIASVVKSIEGLIKISRSYMKCKKQQKLWLSYEIPEFCPCDEINNGVKSLMIGKSSFFKKNGNETIIVLNSETTIMKWTGKVMKKKLKQKVKEFQMKCKQG